VLLIEVVNIDLKYFKNKSINGMMKIDCRSMESLIHSLIKQQIITTHFLPKTMKITGTKNNAQSMARV